MSTTDASTIPVSIETVTPTTETITQAAPATVEAATTPDATKGSETTPAGEDDSCTCPICNMRRQIEAQDLPTGASNFSGGYPGLPSGLSSYLSRLRAAATAAAASSERTRRDVPARSSFFESMRPDSSSDDFLSFLRQRIQNAETSREQTIEVLGVRLPNGQTKLFSTTEELSNFMNNYRGEEDVPEDAELCTNQSCGRCATRRFEEDEVARRERALRKFEARQAAKTEKRRAKFEARQLETNASSRYNPCAGTKKRTGGRRGNRK